MIIGVCGSIAAGKDTLADHLVAKHNFARISWADKLKESVAELFGPILGFDVADCYDQEIKKQQFHHPETGEPLYAMAKAEQPLTLRYLLEYAGTEYGRHLLPDLWILWGKRAAEAAIVGGYSGVVFPDCRFGNEFDAVRAMGGEVWEVQRIGGPEEIRTGHPSDTVWRELPKNYVVKNIWGNPEALYEVVDRQLALVRERQQLPT